MTPILRSLMKIPPALWGVAMCGAVAGAVFAADAKFTGAPGERAPASEAPSWSNGPAADGAASERGDAAAKSGDGVAAVNAASGAAPSHAPSADATPPPPAAPPSDGGLGKTLLLLAVLVAAAIALFYTRRQHGKGWRSALGKRQQELSIRSAVRLGGKWQIALVDVPGSTLVVSAGEGGVQLLTVLPEGGSLEDGGVELDGLDFGPRTTRADTEREVRPERRPPPDAAEPPDAPITRPPRPPSARMMTPQATRSFFADLLGDAQGPRTPGATRPDTDHGQSAQAAHLRERLARYQEAPRA